MNLRNSGIRVFTRISREFVYLLFFLTEMPLSPAYSNLDEGKMRKLMIILSKETKFVVALVFFGDKAWIRFSANVYNSQEDYIKMRNHLADFLKINFRRGTFYIRY